MKLFGEVGVVRGSVAWRKPLRIRLEPPAARPAEQREPVPAQEYDEEGRLYVFRFARSAPRRYSVERDRIFEYMKRHRLPDAGARRFRRDARNKADFIADVRDLQYHPDVSPQAP